MSEINSSVASIPDEELLRRAIRSTIQNGRKRDPNWTRIMGLFGLGSTYSAQLCARFNINPGRLGLDPPALPLPSSPSGRKEK